MVINQFNEPLLFKSYTAAEDDLNIQLHSYASLDFLDEKLIEKATEYLGQVYTIYNLTGEYLIYAFYTATRMKFLAIFKDKGIEKQDDEKVKTFFLKLYKLYRRELYQPFENSLAENKFSKRFHVLLDSMARNFVFR